MFSIPSSWRAGKNDYANVNGAGPANEGESTNDDVFGVMASLSGLAGDVAGTINSLTKGTGKNGTPVNKPVIAPPDPTGDRNKLLIGAALVVAVVVAFLFFRK